MSQFLVRFKKIIPPLSSFKGGNGKIGIIGASKQYTGAAYYSAISALKVGADLVHIFCSKHALIPLKSYSPQLIVHQAWDQNLEPTDQLIKREVQLILKWQNNMSSWVIGPGIGRSEHVACIIKQFLSKLPRSYIVLDADSLFHVTNNPKIKQLLQNHICYLTPNHKELYYINKIFNRSNVQILPKAYIDQFDPPQNHQFVLVAKGKYDYISGFGKGIIVANQGSLKRPGGIGDILAGVLALVSGWSQNYTLNAALSCYLVREASKRAYEKERRSMTAPKVIECLGQCLTQLQQNKKEIIQKKISQKQKQLKQLKALLSKL